LNLSLNTYLIELRNTPYQAPVDLFQGIPCPDPGSCNQYQDSQGRYRVYGIEAAGKWKRQDGMIAYASATLQRGVQYPNDVPMTSSPRYLLKGGLSYPSVWQGWTASAELNVVGSMAGLLNTDGTRTASTPAYALVNAGIVNDHLGNGWSASLRINNLFDRTTYSVASHELQPVELVPAPGRTISLQIRKDF
jgi:outer membrane receptor protein involved in Fe transport